MSECVVRVEMPKSCYECEMRGAWAFCPIGKWPVVGYKKQRHEDCPIIRKLPEGHGRLVDADEIIEAIDEDIELDSRGLDDMTITGRVRERLRLDRGYKKGFKEYLVKRPTIVPATEGGKHAVD